MLEKRVLQMRSCGHSMREDEFLSHPCLKCERITKWHFRFLSLAKFVSGWSKDPSTKVGAVLVRDSVKIVSLGFNGFPQRMPDLEENLFNREEKYSRVVHGEINAILFAGVSVQGCTLYTYPFMPCDRCAVQIIQAGIVRVVVSRASEDAKKRWAESFAKTQRYFVECEVELVEVDFA